MTPRLLGIVLVVLSGCAAQRRLMPVSPEPASLAIPLQQEHLAVAARAAVTEAVSQLDAAALADKFARVQTSGAVGISGESLAFMGAVAEGELAQRGVRIEPKPRLAGVTVQSGSGQNLDGLPPSPDFVLSLSVDAAGVDYVATRKFTAPLAVLISSGGLFLLGLASFGIGQASFDRNWIAPSLVVQGLGITGALVGLVWLLFPPRDLEADARVKLTASVQPAAPGLKGQQAKGSASNKVTIDANTMQLLIP